MATTINDEFMQQIATEQAWKELSENFAWTETLLEKYCDKVDWEEISANTNIIWTIPMLQKFSKKWIGKDCLDKYMEAWNGSPKRILKNSKINGIGLCYQITFLLLRRTPLIIYRLLGLGCPH